MKSVNVTIYRWAGTWGPFKVKIPCGECALSSDVVKDTLENELKGLSVELETKEWLSEWWKPLRAGGWHAPIIMVDGEVISQGHALNRGLLTEKVVAAHARINAISGSHLFGKENCGYCKKAKALLEKQKISYVYHDVVKSPRALYEMLARVKPLISAKTPVTLPQIWLDGHYVGGADQLEEMLI